MAGRAAERSTISFDANTPSPFSLLCLLRYESADLRTHTEVDFSLFIFTRLLSTLPSYSPRLVCDESKVVDLSFAVPARSERRFARSSGVEDCGRDGEAEEGLKERLDDSAEE